jgi:hypothetical protein
MHIVGKLTTVVAVNKGLCCEGLRHYEAISKISRDTTTEVFRIHCVCRMRITLHSGFVGPLCRMNVRGLKCAEAWFNFCRPWLWESA